MALTFWGIEMYIKTAKTQLRYDNPAQYDLWLRKLATNSGHPHNCFRGQDELDKKEVVAIAYVNHGRWVADCPSGCGGAMLLDPEIPFMCGECFNVELDGRWRQIEWPKERAAIEAVLERRRLGINRNWNPGESVADLQAENQEHGVGGGD